MFGVDVAETEAMRVITSAVELRVCSLMQVAPD
jgi:hypothetical protein